MRALRVRLVLASLLLAGCTHAASSGDVVFPKGTLTATNATGSVTLQVEIADNTTLRDRGLMGRQSLATDSGMAFLWPQPTTATFWMKDTLIPLSIAFWDSSGKIVAIKEMTPCSSDPCPTYGAPVPFAGAVEANPGWFDRNGVQVGDRVQLSRSA
jgi:uncharacterized protein